MLKSLLSPKCVTLNPLASSQQPNLAVFWQFGINLVLRRLEPQHFWTGRFTKAPLEGLPPLLEAERYHGTSECFGLGGTLRIL